MSDISAVIITFNEELHIGKCLDSLNGVADEIIVVDSFSIDSTEKICSGFNVRFIKHKFEGYMEQKNFALSMASYKYVLSIDADEALSDELKKSILGIKDSIKYDGYIFNRRNNYYGKWMKHSGLYPDRHLRLFDPTKGKWIGPNPHDKFRLNPGGRSARMKGDIYHWCHSSPEEHVDKMNRFSSIAANEYFRSGRKAGPGKAIIHMVWRFCRSFFLQAGFLDGRDGFMACTISAWSSFLKYSKLRQLNNSAKTTKKITDDI